MSHKRLVILAAAAVVVASSVAAFTASAGAELPSKPESSRTSWPKNERGVTYGSGLDAQSPDDEPDMLKVEATNGKIGYAYTSDLEGPEPNSPAAALAQQEAKQGTPDIIPVYEVNGVTQIGVFVAKRSPDPK